MVECPSGQVKYTRKGVTRCRKSRSKGVTSNKRNIIIERLNKIINLIEKNNRSFKLPPSVPPPPPRGAPPPPPPPSRKNNKSRSPPKPSARNMMLNELRKKIAMKKIN